MHRLWHILLISAREVHRVLAKTNAKSRTVGKEKLTDNDIAIRESHLGDANIRRRIYDDRNETSSSWKSYGAQKLGTRATSRMSRDEAIISISYMARVFLLLSFPMRIDRCRDAAFIRSSHPSCAPAGNKRLNFSLSWHATTRAEDSPQSNCLMWWRFTPAWRMKATWTVTSGVLQTNFPSPTLKPTSNHVAALNVGDFLPK